MFPPRPSESAIKFRAQSRWRWKHPRHSSRATPATSMDSRRVGGPSPCSNKVNPASGPPGAAQANHPGRRGRAGRRLSEGRLSVRRSRPGRADTTRGACGSPQHRHGDRPPSDVPGARAVSTLVPVFLDRRRSASAIDSAAITVTRTANQGRPFLGAQARTRTRTPWRLSSRLRVQQPWASATVALAEA